MFDNSFLNRVFYKLACLLLLPACAAWGGWQAWARPPASGTPAVAAELPATWEGRELRPLALSDVELRFARRFPGSLARMTDGAQVLVLRSVERPTRMLHPAADCYRGLGYAVAAEHLERDAQARLWRCFEAGRPGAPTLRVCERIVDAQGAGFTDTSAWYWAALLGQSQGPWQAVTVARTL